MPPILCKVHGKGEGAVLAVCDKAVCGKTLEEGKMHVEVSERFYKGKEVSMQELKRRLHEFGNINLMGNKAVQAAVEEALVPEETVLHISGVKHAQVFRV